MMKLRRIFLSFLAIVILMCVTAPTASYADRQANEAAEASEGKSGETDKELPGDTTEATDITRRVKIKAKPSCNVNSILDGRNTSVAAVKKDTVLTCTSKVEVGGLYIETEEPAGKNLCSHRQCKGFLCPASSGLPSWRWNRSGIRPCYIPA